MKTGACYFPSFARDFNAEPKPPPFFFFFVPFFAICLLRLEVPDGTRISGFHVRKQKVTLRPDQCKHF
jgi:hypothetical protein